MCGVALPAGKAAVWERDSKTVICLACVEKVEKSVALPVEATHAVEAPTDTKAAIVTAAEPPVVGSAGASARREYQRRKARREKRVRAAHPRIGGLLLALSNEPQSISAWAAGARGEKLLGTRLDGLAERGVRMLHDRRIPRTRANIDHIAVSPGGVFVIDAKRYRGSPQRRVEGGLFRPGVEKLFVGSRDQTKLIGGIHKRVNLVHEALVEAKLSGLPVRGVLCFIEADWPRIGGSFAIDGISVLWPRKLADQLVAEGPLGDPMVAHVHRILAAAFPPA